MKSNYWISNPAFKNTPIDQAFLLTTKHQKLLEIAYREKNKGLILAYTKMLMG